MSPVKLEIESCLITNVARPLRHRRIEGQRKFVDGETPAADVFITCALVLVLAVRSRWLRPRETIGRNH